MTRIRKIGIAFVCLGTLAVLIAYSVYVGRAPRLANEAADIRVSSGYRIQDIYKLNRIPGHRVTGLLVALATNQSVPFDSRNAAVAALKVRHDSSASNEIAALLQPHTYETLRHAAADTLTQLPCPENCAFSVLYYLERTWRGDRNSEDVILDSLAAQASTTVTRDQIKSQIKQAQQEQQQLVSELESVLSKNPEQTLAVLRNVYGLGSYDPSYFAIYMVGELHLSQACPDLKRHLLDEIAGEKLATQIRAVRQRLCKSE